MFDARAFEFDTNLVVSLLFDINSGFCYIYRFVIIPERSFDLEWKESNMNRQYG